MTFQFSHAETEEIREELVAAAKADSCTFRLSSAYCRTAGLTSTSRCVWFPMPISIRCWSIGLRVSVVIMRPWRTMMSGMARFCIVCPNGAEKFYQTTHHRTSGEPYVNSTDSLFTCFVDASTSPQSRSQTPASLAIDGVHEHAIDPCHDPIGPLHSGCNQRLRPRTWPAVLQIFGAFQMTGDQYPSDDA
jgi:hypothetical protein